MSDNDDSGFDLTRRKVLGGLATVGAASAAAGAGTFALFSDTESSTDNVIQAGTLDLKAEDGDSAVTTFDLSTKAPGDSGTARTNVSNAGSLDGYLAFTVGDATNTEPTPRPDPEKNADPDLEGGTSTGELGKWLSLEMGFVGDGNSLGSDAAVDGYLTGSGSPFPNTGGMEKVRFNDNEKLPATDGSGNDGKRDFVVEWEIDEDAGNEIQGDEVEVDLTFELMQQGGDRDVVLDGDTVYAQGKGFSGTFNTTSAASHVGKGSWQAQDDGQQGLYFGSEFSDFDALPVPTFSDIEQLRYWMKHSRDTVGSDFMLQIFTKPRGDGSDSVGGSETWYNAKYTAVPPEANGGSPVWTPGAWNKFGTASGAQNQLYFYLQDNQNVSVEPRTLTDLQSNHWTVNGYEYPKSDDEVLAFALLTNSEQSGFTGYLDDVYFETSDGSVSIDLEP
jgi:predicted ribosomally synthesized peptide with SipW-like signal peptide